MALRFDRARPVWLEDGGKPNVYANFYARFPAGKAETRLLVAADSHYAVYVNGKYVYAAQFADDVRERVYDEIELTDLVKPGENELRVAGYCTRTESSVYRYGGAYVIFEVFADGRSAAASGAHTPCCLDAGYAQGEAPVITWQMGYTFSYDGTRAEGARGNARLTGEMPVFVPRPIRQCALGPRREAELLSQGVYLESADTGRFGDRMQRAFLAFREREEMGVSGELPPRFPQEAGLEMKKAGGEGMYFVFDLGRNEVGLMDVELTLPETAEVLIGWGEHLDDLRVRTCVGGRNFLSRWLAPAGRSRFFHPFRRIGARYVQLFVGAEKVKIHYAGLMPVTYPLPAGAELVLADALHQKIYETCKRTLVMCMHEHYEDCPWREQALYAMDSRNQMLTGYYAFGEYAFARASLRTLGRSLREDGLLELCAPARVRVDIPSFSLMYLVEMWEYLWYSGDDTLARELMPVCKTIIDTAASRLSKNGLVPRYAGPGMWNFYEWSPELDGGDLKRQETDENRFDAPLNAFFVLALEAYAHLCEHLESGEEARKARAAADQVRAAAHAAFYQPGKGYYATYLEDGRLTGGSELTQALCVCAGICPGEELENVLSRLTDGTLIPVTLAYSIFKYEALMKKPEEYGGWVKADIERQWGGMLYQNATSFWETISGAQDFERGGSLCHGWSAVPAYIYWAYGAGVRSTEPGWKNTEIRPAAGLPYVKTASVRRPDGSIQTIR